MRSLAVFFFLVFVLVAEVQAYCDVECSCEEPAINYAGEYDFFENKFYFWLLECFFLSNYQQYPTFEPDTLEGNKRKYQGVHHFHDALGRARKTKNKELFFYRPKRFDSKCRCSENIEHSQAVNDALERHKVDAISAGINWGDIKSKSMPSDFPSIWIWNVIAEVGDALKKQKKSSVKKSLMAESPVLQIVAHTALKDVLSDIGKSPYDKHQWTYIYYALVYTVIVNNYDLLSDLDSWLDEEINALKTLVENADAKSNLFFLSRDSVSHSFVFRTIGDTLSVWLNDAVELKQLKHVSPLLDDIIQELKVLAGVHKAELFEKHGDEYFKNSVKNIVVRIFTEKSIPLYKPFYYRLDLDSWLDEEINALKTLVKNADAKSNLFFLSRDSVSHSFVFRTIGDTLSVWLNDAVELKQLKHVSPLLDDIIQELKVLAGVHKAELFEKHGDEYFKNSVKNIVVRIFTEKSISLYKPFYYRLEYDLDQVLGAPEVNIDWRQWQASPHLFDD